MTLPASGPISMSQVNTELLISPSTTTITMNDSGVRFLTGTSTGTTDSMQQLLGKSYVIAANSGILTSGSSYTLPQTSGVTVKVLAIAGGAGGGGGSDRTSFSGYYTGGGGGGAGGNAYATITVTPGATISFSIGGGGGGGAYRDGIYSGGSNGSAGSTTYITYNGSTVAQASTGAGGLVSPNASGGSAGGVNTGSALVSATAGGTAADSATTGGQGAPGYNVNTTVGAGTILTLGSYGTTYAEGSGGYGTSGTGYGSGGSGGGCAQSDRVNYNNIFSTAGSAGAVFIWWGY